MAKKEKKKESKKKQEKVSEKQESEEQPGPENKKKTKERQNKQVRWAIFLMLAIVLIIILVPYITKNYINKFEYIDLDFQKTKLGELMFYSTRVPVADSNLKLIGTYSMNFRSDPRNESINVSVPNKTITFNKGKTIFVSLDPEMQACPDNMVALMNLGSFLRDFAGLKIQSTVTDKEYAKENNATYASCEKVIPNTVIEIRSGNNTEIRQVRENCFEMTYANCEIIPVTERFMLVILEQYMKFFVRA